MPNPVDDRSIVPRGPGKILDEAFPIEGWATETILTAKYIQVGGLVQNGYAGMIALLAYFRREGPTLNAAFEDMKKRISKWDFEQFKSLWRAGRQFVSLQERLFMEQMFWDLGKPWRSLITGFSVIKEPSERIVGKGVIPGQVRYADPYYKREYVKRTRH